MLAGFLLSKQPFLIYCFLPSENLSTTLFFKTEIKQAGKLNSDQAGSNLKSISQPKSTLHEIKIDNRIFLNFRSAFQ
jgi:hypothetical protein